MKKVLFSLLGLIIVLLTWAFWPEYGSGYSEEQRCLWNEQRTVYPLAWSKDALRPRDSWDVAEILGIDESEVKAQLIVKKSQAENILKKLKSNRNKEALDWQVTLPENPDLSKLPLNGLSKGELIEKAKNGDGDACLLIVSSICGGNYLGTYELSWGQIRDVQKWLDKAIEWNRPGAEFLKNYFDLVKKSQKINRAQKGGTKLKKAPGTQDVMGYPEFAKQIRQGDYLLYKVMSRMVADFDPPLEKQIIYDAILPKAQQGDAVAQSDIGALFFENSGTSVLSEVATQIYTNTSAFKNKLDWMPDSLATKTINLIKKLGLMSARDTSIVNRYEEACYFLRQAALQGDLRGMDLWLRYGITGCTYLSRKEWNDIFAYSQELVEAGYTPQTTRHIEGRYDSLQTEILYSFYTQKSIKSLFTLSEKHLTRRNDSSFVYYNQWNYPWKKNDLETNKKAIELLQEVEGRDYVARSAFLILERSEATTREYLISVLEKFAKEGDVNALLKVAEIYEKGKSVPVDLGKAYAYYKEATQYANDYPLWQQIYQDEFVGENKYAHGIVFPNYVKLKMITMVIKHPDFPGRDEKRAFEDALSLEKYATKTPNTTYCYVIGQVYEKGIGTPKDEKKALSFYKLSKPVNYHKGSKDAIKRLETE